MVLGTVDRSDPVPVRSLDVELIDLPHFGPEEEGQIAGGEVDPYGTDHLGIEWQAKTEHVALVDGDRLIGHAGWVPSRVVAAGGEEVEALGLGGVMVHPDYRGHGLGAGLVGGAVERMRSNGGSLAILFCRTERLAFYGRLGWVRAPGPVSVGQRKGPIDMPLHTCWTPLAQGAELPDGPLRFKGLPF